MRRWKVRFSRQAKKQLRKLDNSVREFVEDFLKRLPDYSNPHDLGKALKGQFAGLWRYSVGDYRIICSIHDNVLVVEVVKIGHRSKVYRE